MQTPNGIYYASEKLGLAVHELAIGRGDVRSRLRRAYRNISAVVSDDFPEPLKEDFEQIKQELTKYDPVGTEGRLNATFDKMRNATGEKIAAQLVNLQEAVDAFLNNLQDQ